MTEPAYTITGQPANPEAALAAALAFLETYAAEFVPLTARQRDERRALLACIDAGRRLLPGYVAAAVAPGPVPVAIVEEECGGEMDWAKGRTERGRGERV